MSQASALYETLEKSPLTKNHIKVISAAVLGDLLEFFDFTLISFVLTFIVTPWKLNYGETTIILLSSGVGAMIGAFIWGILADRFGRRPIFIATVLTFSLSTGVMYFTPEGSWEFLSVFRFITGFGVGGLYSIDLPLVQEFVPSRYRGRVGGIITSAVPIGTLCSSLLAAFLSAHIGWRGLFLVGLVPSALTLLIRAWVPESPRWLIRRGRYQEAEAAVAWVTGKHTTFTVKDIAESKQEAEAAQPHPSLMELFKYPRSVIVSWMTNLSQQCGYYCFTMWGPTLLALILGKTPAQAAKLFIAVTLTGFVGRWFWAFASDWFGRKKCGFVLGSMGAILLILASHNYDTFIFGSVSLFWLFMCGIYFFVDGGFAITGPYSSEVWPAHLRATGMGSAYGFGGIGKILGPMAVAFFAGSSNLVSPKATLDAIVPVYTFIAVMFFIMSLTYLYGIETRNKSMEEIDEMLGVPKEQSLKAAGQPVGK